MAFAIEQAARDFLITHDYHGQYFVFRVTNPHYNPLYVVADGYELARRIAFMEWGLTCDML